MIEYQAVIGHHYSRGWYASVTVVVNSVTISSTDYFFGNNSVAEVKARAIVDAFRHAGVLK